MNRMLAIRQEAGLKAAYQVGMSGVNKWGRKDALVSAEEPAVPIPAKRSHKRKLR